MARHNRIMLRWDATTDIVITVQAYARGRIRTGEEWRLENDVASLIWAVWHLDQVEAPAAE